MAFCKVITVTGYLLLVSYGIGLAQKHRIPDCKRSLKEQQEAGDIDSSDVNNYLKLGTYGMYKSLINDRAFSRGKGNPGHTGYVEADHIPPLKSLKMAKEKPEFGELEKKNLALYNMLMSLKEDKGGMNLFAVQVATHHHRAALSTGSSRDSQAVRAVLTCKIARGEVVPMLKQAMMIAHPFVSQSMRGIPRSFPGEKCSLSDDRTTKIYETGFLGLIDFNYNANVITEKERNELKGYVRQHYALGGNFAKDSIEYREILETVKQSLQR